MELCAYFNFLGENIIIPCTIEEQFGKIVGRLCGKINKDPDSLLFFYNQRPLTDKNQEIKNIINSFDLNTKSFDILTFVRIDSSGINKYQVKVEINYKNDITTIIPKQNDKMENIFKTFLLMKRIDENSIYFCFKGRIVLKGLKFEDYSNYDGKNRNKLEISVVERDSESIIKSNQIICPVCGESSQIKLKNKKFEIYGCKNKHIIDDLTFDEFEKTQLIDISKIICNECKFKSKYESYNYTFFYCFNCDMNLCPICKEIHSNHFTIKDDLKLYYCNKHKKPYNHYCNTCKENICLSNENSHFNHEIIKFSTITTHKADFTRRMNLFKENIFDFGKIIKDIKDFLDNIEENLKRIYEFNNNLIKDYNPDITNYQYLANLNILKELYSTNIQDIGKFKNSTNYQEKFNNIIKIYNNLSGEESVSFEEPNNKEIENKIIENEKIIKEYAKTNIEKENQIINLKNKVSEYEKLLIAEKRKVKELDKNLKDNESKCGISKKLGDEKVFELMAEINRKNKELEELRKSIPISINPGEKLMTVIFVSTDKKIHYAIICKNTDKFSTIENKLYDEYPQYSENENFFLVNGNRINRHKDLDYNNIKNSDIIMLFPFE